MKLTELKPAAYNPRKDLKEGDPEYEMIKKSILDNGLVQPIIWNKQTGNICGGHQRYKIIKQLGYEETEVVVIDVDETKEKSMNIMLNKAIGDWDDKRLALILKEAKKNDWLDKTGFEEDDLKELVESLQEDTLKEGLTDPDDVPEPKETKIKVGDIFKLGRHRLMCGDSTDKRQVEALMDGKKADMVFTDPPYGVGYADKNKFLNSIDKGNCNQKEIENDHKTIDDLRDNIIYPAFCRIKESLNDKASYYITAPQGGDLLMMMMMMMKAGLTLRHMIIWCKNNHVLGRCDYNYKHEPLLFGWIDTHNFYGNGEHKFSTWNIDKPHKSDLHPTMKPVELVVNAIKNSSKKDNIVLDVFGGSGTTLIACEQTDRTCNMMELDPIYVEVIKSRWERFTGAKAEQL